MRLTLPTLGALLILVGASCRPAPSTLRPAYTESQVEKKVRNAPGNPQPQYPEMFLAGKGDGKVLVQFVVDVNGKADMSTLKVLESSHELFTREVRRVLPQMRFFPAEVGDKKVRQVVQQPFFFRFDM